MKKVLVLGASPNVDRYSNMAMKKLEAKGFTVFSLGKRKGSVGTMKIETEQFPIENLYAISLYLNAANQVDYYSYIVQLMPEKVIFNPGAENRSLEAILDKHEIPFERACTLVLLNLDQL